MIRRRVKELIRDIEREAAAERRRTGKPVRGAEAVMEVDPYFRPTKRDRSPAPDFHARRKDVRKAMRDAYTLVVVEYRKAAERLRDGDRMVSFPEVHSHRHYHSSRFQEASRLDATARDPHQDPARSSTLRYVLLPPHADSGQGVSPGAADARLSA